MIEKERAYVFALLAAFVLGEPFAFGDASDLPRLREMRLLLLLLAMSLASSIALAASGFSLDDEASNVAACFFREPAAALRLPLSFGLRLPFFAARFSTGADICACSSALSASAAGVAFGLAAFAPLLPFFEPAARFKSSSALLD